MSKPVLSKLLQSMDLVTHKVTYDIVLEREGGDQFRLPVPEGRAQDLIQWICADAPEEEEEEEEKEASAPDLPDWRSDEQEEQQESLPEFESDEDEEEEGAVLFPPMHAFSGPASEEDVPGL